MAETSNFAQPSIPKFDGDYDHWSMLMENLLRSKEYWSIVETGYTEPPLAEKEKLGAAEKKSLEELKLKDLKAKNYLFQSIDKSILKTIIQKDTSKQLWDSMKRKYQGNKRVQRAQLQTLRRDFEILEMKSGESVNEYFSKVMLVANDMRNAGEDMPDVKIVEKILRTLTEKFNYIVCSIEESKDIDQLSVDELQSSLLVHEQKFRKVNGEEQALKVTSGEIIGGRGRGYTRGRGRGRGGRQPFTKANIECFKCHKFGHFQYECPNWDKNVNYTEFDEEMVLMAHAEMDDCTKEGMWFLDSGCSNHMTGNKKWFIQLDETFRGAVKLGNDSKMVVMGKGNIRVQINGKTQVITEVYYIPELKSNLISVGQLQDKGLAISIQNSVCKIYHPVRGLIMQTNMSSNKTFVLLATAPTVIPDQACFQMTSEDMTTELWHRRFGHLNMKGLRMLAYRKMVDGLPIIKASKKLCTSCVIGKQHRDSFPKKSLWRATKPLQLVHSDICGPITPESNSHKRYVLTFIDDYSRKTWSYFLHAKSEAFTMFKISKAW